MANGRTDQYRRWYAYEVDSHAKTVAALSASEAACGNEAAWQKAVDLLAHVAAARRLWLFRLGWTPRPPADVFPRGVGLHEAERQLEEVEREWEAVLRRLTDAELDREFEYASLEGPRFRNRVEDILTQLFGHSWYHRGQIRAAGAIGRRRARGDGLRILDPGGAGRLTPRKERCSDHPGALACDAGWAVAAAWH